jgi:protein-S-isoprenylcysteine O-methyltransferase Ste14
MEKLAFYGVGPKIGRIVLPYLAITIAMTILFPAKFTMSKTVEYPFMVSGIILIAISLMLYFTTLRLMLPGIKNNRLVTGGMYRFCRNPLYTALLLFFMPGLALLMNSWIILTVPVLGVIILKKHIHEEEDMLERIFGDEYRNYRKRTGLLMPNPLKWFR